MVKTILTTLSLLLLLPLFSLAQSPKVSLGLKFAPGVNIPIYRNGFEPTGSTPRFGFRTVGDIRLQWGSGIFFETGLEVTRITEGSTWSPMILSCDIDPGGIDTSGATSRWKREDYYIGIPIGMGYQIRPGKWGLAASIGATVNIPKMFVRSTVSIKGETCDPAVVEGTISNTSMTRTIFTINPYVNIDFLYEVVPILDVTAGITAQTTLIVAQDSPAGWQQNSFFINPGASVGIRLKLGRS